jgi:hypothetical protein
MEDNHEHRNSEKSSKKEIKSHGNEKNLKVPEKAFEKKSNAIFFDLFSMYGTSFVKHKIKVNKSNNRRL